MARSSKPWFRKDRKAWFVTINGERHNLGPDRKRAFQQFHDLMRQPDRPPPAIQAGRPIVGLIDKFLEWVAQHRLPETYVWYQSRLQRFAERYPDLLVDRLKPFHVQEWIDSFKVASGSKRNYARAIVRCLNWCEEQGHIERSPLVHFKNRAFYAMEPDYIAMPAIETFRDAESHAATLAHELTHWTRHPSRLTDEQHSHMTEMAERYAGLAIYRDQLRVMPYGRALADHFGIEERRSKHLGRAFWSYRRTFGRIAITRDDNPNLKDKAGREGLIDNQAKREFRMLVVEILEATARRFFGTGSEPRNEYLPDIITENTRAKQAEENTQSRRKAAFRKALQEGAPMLKHALEEAAAAKEQVKRIVAAANLGALVEFDNTLQYLESEKSTLKLPTKPTKLGTLEDEYRSYRDRYAGFCAATDELRKDWAEAVEKIKKKPAIEEGRSTAAAHVNQLDKSLREWRTRILGLLGRETDRIKADIEADRLRYKSQSDPLVDDLIAGRSKLPDLVRQLEGIREAMHLDFAQRYGGYLRVLENLSQGIDIDALTTWSVEQRQEMQGRVEQLHALAQLGVTVELVGHELETHDDEISRHLKALPASTQQKKLQESIKGLFNQLRFVTPLQLSGRKFLKEMTGEEIADYVKVFFEARFQRAKVTFRATAGFRTVKFREYPARIYPVFINLVNNSLYWVSMGAKREILLDVVDEDIVVADTGRGVDADDVNSLFQLFFTRRTEGRGVGLYLCRANLAAGGHTIVYASDKAHRLLPGANFVIKLRGLQRG